MILLLSTVQRCDTLSSPICGPMTEARGEKIVMSAPRSFNSLSWFSSMVSRISSSDTTTPAGAGFSGSLKCATWASRKLVSGAGAVV